MFVISQKIFLLLFLNLFTSLLALITFLKTKKASFLFFCFVFSSVFIKDLFFVFNFIALDNLQIEYFAVVMSRVLEFDVVVLIFWAYVSYIKKLKFTEKVVFYFFVSLSVFYLILGLMIGGSDKHRVPLLYTILFYLLIYSFLIYSLIKIIKYHSGFYYKNIVGKRLSFVVIYILVLLFTVYFAVAAYCKVSYIYFNLVIAILNFVVINIFSFKKYKELKRKILFMEKEHQIQFDMIDKINGMLVKDSTFKDILNKIISNLLEVLKAQSGAVFIYDNKKEILQAQGVVGLYPPLYELIHHNKTRIEYINDILLSKKFRIGETYIGMVAKKRKSLVIRDLSSTSSIVSNCMGLIDFRSLIVVPMLVKDELIGVLSLVHSPEKNFNSHEKSIVETIAKQAAVSIRNIWFYDDFIHRQLTERELEIAAYIQKNLFPKALPEMNGVSIFSYNSPAKEMGGDYYDIIDLPDGKTGIFICDVAGKGVPAALIMVMIRSIFRTISSLNKNPGEMLSELNRNLCEQNSLPETFATAFYFIYDPNAKRIQYSNAGHSPLLIFSKSGITKCDTDGLPVGISEDTTYDMGERKLKKSEVLLLYTDGISEAKNSENKFYGDDRIVKVVERNIDSGVKFIGSQIIHHVEKFVKDTPQYDDQTIVLIKILS